MEVETYVREDMEILITETDQLEEWKQKVDECELHGQKKLIEKAKSPVPFSAMTAEEWNVYKILCPQSEPLDEFSQEAIPLRVMSVIALCKQENYFDEIKVWHAIATPDPIIIGKIEEVFYLIAKWGREILPYSKLKELAEEIVKKDIVHDAKRMTSNYEERLNNPENFIRERFDSINTWSW